ncbi:MAG: hypothetical protein ACVCEJ_00025 [Candidatus Izemoplasmataceae bacterium]
MDKKRLIELKNKSKKKMLNAWDYVKKHTVLVGFYLLAFVFFINAVVMSLHFINREYDYKKLNRLYIEAVLPGQDIVGTGRASTGIVKIKELNIDKLTTDDQVVICCDFGIDENWVEEVVSIDTENDLLETTYDGIVLVEVNSEDIYGVYIKEANFFGTIYYTSTFLRGYILLMVTQAIILFLFHRLFVRKVLEGLLKKKAEQAK